MNSYFIIIFLNFGKLVLIQNSNTEPMFLHLALLHSQGKDVSTYKMTVFILFHFISKIIKIIKVCKFARRYEYLEDVKKRDIGKILLNVKAM